MQSWTNAPVNAADGAPHVKIVFASNGTAVGAFAALSHRERVANFRFVYGRDAADAPGTTASGGGFNGVGAIKFPVRVEFEFDGRRCTVDAYVGFQEETKEPSCN